MGASNRWGKSTTVLLHPAPIADEANPGEGPEYFDPALRGGGREPSGGGAAPIFQNRRFEKVLIDGMTLKIQGGKQVPILPFQSPPNTILSFILSSSREVYLLFSQRLGRANRSFATGATSPS